MVLIQQLRIPLSEIMKQERSLILVEELFLNGNTLGKRKKEGIENQN